MSATALASAFAVACLLGSCSSVELAPPVATARTGPALGKKMQRIVAVQATCGSLSALSKGFGNTPGKNAKANDLAASKAVACTKQQIDGVDQLVRAALEFHGYGVIDSERVNATTLSRQEIIRTETTNDGRNTERSSSQEATVRGSLFDDAPPSRQDEILKELGADGLLNARVIVGAAGAYTLRRPIDVQIRLLHVASGELVWASRCRVEAGWTLNEGPLMKATQCAIDRITAARRLP